MGWVVRVVCAFLLFIDAEWHPEDHALLVGALVLFIVTVTSRD